MGLLRDWLKPILTPDLTATEFNVAVAIFRMRVLATSNTQPDEIVGLNKRRYWIHLYSDNVVNANSGGYSHSGYDFLTDHLAAAKDCSPLIDTIKRIVGDLNAGMKEGGHCASEGITYKPLYCVTWLPSHRTIFASALPYFNVYEGIALSDSEYLRPTIKALDIAFDDESDIMCRYEEKLLVGEWFKGNHPAGRKTLRPALRKIIA